MWGDTHPRCCLKLGPHAAVWAERGRRWGRCEERCAVRPLPLGLIKPSPVELNVSDMAMLKHHLLELSPSLGPHGPGRWPVRILPRPATLLVPDLCVRAALVRLEHLPAESEEQAALIRWRAAQEQLLPAAGTHVAYQVLNDRGADNPTTVLALAIREQVLHQFESVCEGVGLNPFEVEPVTVRLFNLWGRATGWFRHHIPPDLLWVSMLDGGLTVMAFHQGTLVYFRTRLLSPDPGERGGPREGVPRVVEDVLASLSSCSDAFPQAVPGRFVLASDVADPGVFDALRQELAIEGEELDWRVAQRAGWRAGKGQGGFAAISGVAGLLGR